MEALLIIVGLVLLVLGGNMLVSGAVRVAEGLKVSKAIVGVVLVGFGTSTPELAASLQAALSGAPDLTVGNIVGSNIANSLFILGAAALISPFVVPRAGLWRDSLLMTASALALIGALMTGGVTRTIAGAMIAGLVLYLVWAIADEGRARRATAGDFAAAEPPPAPSRRLGLAGAILFAVGGIAVTILGARFLVDGAVGIARALQVSDALIGLTIVAVGTSLPEFAVSLLAARKGHGEIAFANVVGSNIYNIFGVAGITALIAPLPASPQIVAVDIWVMAAAIGATLAFAWTAGRLARWEGALLLLGYAAYVGWLVAQAIAG